MLPHVGGNWNNGASAGVFSVNLNTTATNTNNNNGARAGMTDRAIVQRAVDVMDRPRPEPADHRPWWRRLVSSLRVSLLPGKSIKRPISGAKVTGRVEW